MTLRGAGIYGGMAPGQVDADALAELIRRKTAELAAASARCGDRQRQDGRDERKETGR